jgi:hypothetical protein
MEVLTLDTPVEQMGWVLALVVAGVFLLIVAVVAFWLPR